MQFRLFQFLHQNRTPGSIQPSLSPAGQQWATETGWRAVTWSAHWITSLQGIWDKEGRGLEIAGMPGGYYGRPCNKDSHLKPAPMTRTHLMQPFSLRHNASRIVGEFVCAIIGETGSHWCDWNLPHPNNWCSSFLRMYNTFDLFELSSTHHE